MSGKSTEALEWIWGICVAVLLAFTAHAAHREPSPSPQPSTRQQPGRVRESVPRNDPPSEPQEGASPAIPAIQDDRAFYNAKTDSVSGAIDGA